ncbi:hypothetical protein SAY86_026900 [Trapa natans]|uniref:WRKY19-like zinc finger domain-containing protein n=1 Tax=Trapa natans TaxID=22666 RepID=A0AAN7KLF5_TRANT|nr:hypothetical protein SAY86_026900 [Trapa natans]
MTKMDDFGDTALSLNCVGYGASDMLRLKKNSGICGAKFTDSSDDGCRLVLGLGPTPSACYNGLHGTNKGGESGAFSLHNLASEGDSILKLGLSGVTKEAFSPQKGPAMTENNFSVSHNENSSRFSIPVVDEGSTTAKKSGGYMPSLLLAPRMNGSKLFLTQEPLEFGTTACYLPPQLQTSSDLSASAEISIGTVSEQTTANTSLSHASGSSKKCMSVGCLKGARGASGLCIGHGGGQRCQKPGCNKGAESRTAYCKTHGGGRRCQHLGCTKGAEGKTDFCIAHGGGRRCGHSDGCTKAARGKSGLCIRHGGGKRCKMEGCIRSAEGQAGLCISHGGGRRCQFPDCKKGAQGSTMYCKAHGGGKRCIFSGCTKGAEGSTPLCKGHGGGKRCLFDGGGICPKSVHGGTNFCVAHGGGKRCVVTGCTKSARGRTDCCVKHGGGKRCKYAGCGKSAQGSTDFCKAHGGGKRCTWPEQKCEKFARGKSGLCAAHGNMALERETNGPGLFQGLVSASSTTLDNNRSSSGISTASDCIESLERPTKCQNLIPPEVLVPLSMKSSSSFSAFHSSVKPVEDGRRSSSVIKGFDSMIPEGRVHGGGLMSLLGENLNNNRAG